MTWEYVVFLVAYFLGAIPYAFLAGKIKGIDIRHHGSGNLGATNAYRLLGKKWGIAVLVFDALKGALATYLCMLYFGPWGGVIGGLLAMIGHSYSPYFLFKPSGKGVACGFGVICILMPKVMLVGLAVFIIVTAISRYVSLGSMFGALAVFVTALVFREHLANIIFTAVSVVIVLLRHRANIRRIIEGTEPKFGVKK
ncbi:MAG: glycerol-3-phosphate 1-O-acyltransferase PlsY [Desulfitobacteriia bacterium]|jgi:glycerol-3-phosphate acyltransferase PlsY